MTPLKHYRRHAVLGAVFAVALAGTASPASAQFFGGGMWGGGMWGNPPMWGGPVYRERVIPPRFVAVILRGQGYRLAEAPVRRGETIVALGMDRQGMLARFLLGAYDGSVLRVVPLGAPRPSSAAQGYASGGPEAVESDMRRDEPVRPKLKPKVKTATRSPAPLPHAAPASPQRPPSLATRPPADLVAPASPGVATPTVATPGATSSPVVSSPVVSPPVASPVAVTPPALPVTASAPPATSPAPQTPAAPDAQPRDVSSGDVGPKVVPVRPAEARGPDTPPPPAAWDTEAAPKIVTPAEANSMAPERHPDQ